MQYLRFICVIPCLLLSIIANGQDKQDLYNQHWVTDIPIWYNCGGFHALINYNFKGNGEIEIEDECGSYGQRFTYEIKDGRLIKYRYYNGNNMITGRIEKHGISAYYSASASFGYEEKTITHHLSMYTGTGVGHDINFDYQIINKDSILKRCGYKDYRHMRIGTLLKKNDSTAIDTIPIVSPYYTWGSTIKKLYYEVNPTRIKIYANNSLSTALVLEYNNNGDIKHISNNGIKYFFRNHKYDRHGNWTEVDVFDPNGSFVKKCRRKIEYFDNPNNAATNSNE